MHVNEIPWDAGEKYAIACYLLLSLDKKTGKDELARFDALFGLNGNEPMMDGEGENAGARAKRETRDAIVRDCEKFLDSLDESERCDVLTEEIDRFIEGGGGITILWKVVQLITAGSGYSASQKRLLKHLARKLEVEAAMLPVLEDAAKRFLEIARERKDLSEGELPYREVTRRLAGLDAEEEELRESLKKYGVFPDNLTNKEEEEYQERTMADKIGDAVVEGIYKIGDIICAPFDWMTERL
jgi:hypothetical protein